MSDMTYMSTTNYELQIQACRSYNVTLF